MLRFVVVDFELNEMNDIGFSFYPSGIYLFNKAALRQVTIQYVVVYRLCNYQLPIRQVTVMGIDTNMSQFYRLPIRQVTLSVEQNVNLIIKP